MDHAEWGDARERRLRQRLHDGLGQSLSLAVLQIDRVSATPGTEALRGTRALLREALQELRSLISSIDQPAADALELDLPARLEACVRRLNAVQEIPVSCTIEGAPLRLSPQACEVLLSATRELLVNACKHGEAISVDARLSVLPHRLSITVTERLKSSRAESGACRYEPGQRLGLRSARQGLSSIGARLRWRHGGPNGVQARIHWVPQ